MTIAEKGWNEAGRRWDAEADKDVEVGDAFSDALNEAASEMKKAEDRIMVTRATTPEGFAVKTRLMEKFRSSEDFMEHPLFKSILADAEHCIARRAS